MRAEFRLTAPFEPVGDQPAAIEALVQGFRSGKKEQTLMGVTGSGKTFTMAHVAARLGLPTLVLSHNKTLAAQLFGEFREFFPKNAVHYFVSYYDYYQPEAYIPQKDIYIEKDSSVNQEIDRLRLAATAALVSRPDTLVVSSVSCLYGLGSPESFARAVVNLRQGEGKGPEELCARLVDVYYTRNDISCERGTFRRRGDTVEIFPPGEQGGLRVEFFGQEIERLRVFDPVSSETLSERGEWTLYPARHYVISPGEQERALLSIEEELHARLAVMRAAGHHLEAHRLDARTRHDLDMIRQVGYCSGIENYSRHFENRPAGSRPFTLTDYFGKEWLLIIDESHVTLPQIGAMSFGDRSRKQTLVDHGFRLPSALDNRPMTHAEFFGRADMVLYVSATPGPHELSVCGGRPVEQLVRPTGLLDPLIEVRPVEGQVADLTAEIKACSQRGERVLVTTLTKRLAENLSEYFSEHGLKVRWLHSDLDSIERMTILRELREGLRDVVVGVNLLREGLDLPEVALVAILDADAQGFLRSATSLIQTVGRSARHENARVIMYAHTVSEAMRQAIDETSRRRAVQEAYNKTHGITPQGIRKAIRLSLEEEIRERSLEAMPKVMENDEAVYRLEGEMLEAAAALDFEKAAQIRNRISEIRPDWTVDGTRLEKVHGAKRKKAGAKGRRR
ncbi:MAG: excinuclease ABC subunit UvrB [Planctomycetota bacterium]